MSTFVSASRVEADSSYEAHDSTHLNQWFNLPDQVAAWAQLDFDQLSPWWENYSQLDAMALLYTHVGDDAFTGQALTLIADYLDEYQAIAARLPLGLPDKALARFQENNIEEANDVSEV